MDFDKFTSLTNFIHNFIDVKLIVFFATIISISPLTFNLYAQDTQNITDEQNNLSGAVQSNKSNVPPEKESALTVISPRHPYDLNPHTSQYNTESQILSGLYEGLYTQDPATGECLLAIAKSAKVSRRGTRWVFVINEGLKFSDGSPLTALSVRDSWLRLLDTKNAPYSSLFDIVKGAKEYRTGRANVGAVEITAIDNTLSLTLVNPASHLPKILCMPSFAVVGGSDKNPLYSGAYMLDHINGDEAVLTKNLNYVNSDKVQLSKITFKFSDNDGDNAFMYNTGAADWVASSVDIDKLLDKSAAHIMAEFATEYIFFKMRDNVWRNRNFREALLCAVPYEELRDKTFVPASTLVYPVMGYPAVNGWDSRDATEAAILMQKARDEVGIGDTRLSIKVAIMDSERGKSQSQLLKNAWEELGVDVLIDAIPPNEYLSRVDNGDADIYTYTWIGDYFDPLAFLELFRSDSTLNVANYKSEAYDNYLKEASETLDAAKRLQILALAEQQLLDDAVVIPIQHPVSLNVIDLQVIGGWALNSFDIHPLKYLYKKTSDEDALPNVPGFVMIRGPWGGERVIKKEID